MPTPPTFMPRSTSSASTETRAPAGGGLTPLREPVRPALKVATSGFVPEKMPLGFGYQSQTCSVIRFGCQKLKAAPVPGAFAGHALCAAAGTNVPSL